MKYLVPLECLSEVSHFLYYVLTRVPMAYMIFLQLVLLPYIHSTVLPCIIGTLSVVEEMNTVRFFEEMLNTSSTRSWSMGSSSVEENCLMADIITIHTNNIINRRVKINRSRALLFGSSDTRVTLLCRVGRTSFSLSMKMVTSVGLNLLKDTFLVRELSDLLLEESPEINFASSSL